MTALALIWSAIVYRVALHQSQVPVAVTAVFVAMTVLFVGVALSRWRQRLRGGGATLALSHDPVPHGAPVTATFDLGRMDGEISAKAWKVTARIDTTEGPQSGFGQLWEQTFAVQPSGRSRAIARFQMPFDLPSTAASSWQATYRASLTLEADGIRWVFRLQSWNPAVPHSTTFETVPSPLGTGR